MPLVFPVDNCKKAVSPALHCSGRVSFSRSRSIAGRLMSNTNQGRHSISTKRYQEYHPK